VNKNDVFEKQYKFATHDPMNKINSKLIDNLSMIVVSFELEVEIIC